MRAEFAALICSYGERARAMEVFKRSFEDAVAYLLENEIQDIEHQTGIFELVVRLSDMATGCDSTSQTSLLDEINHVGAKEDEIGKEPAIVPDKTWGSKPSLRRELSAEILGRTAFEKARQGNLDEAEKFLERSLEFCVTELLGGTLSELIGRERQEAAFRLFIMAARKVMTLPSGAELQRLKSALNRMTRSLAAPSRTASDQSMNRLTGAYLDAISRLVKSPYSTLAAASPYIITRVKESLPYYSTLRPDDRLYVEEWIVAATKDKFAPALAAVSQPSLHETTAAQRASKEVSELEEIASKSTDQKERDLAYASIASTQISMGKFDEAYDAASKVSNQALKTELFDDATYSRIRLALRSPSDLRSLAQDINKISSLTLRIKLHIQLSAVVTRKDALLANEALEDALRLAAKLAPSAAQSHLLLNIASVYANFNTIRALEVLNETIKSINKHRDQPASRWGLVRVSGMAVDIDSQGRFPRAIIENPEQYRRAYDFSLLGKLARTDFDGAMLAASSLREKSLQMSAKYEICAGILEGNKKKGGSTELPPQ